MKNILPWILTAVLGLAVINLYFKVYDKKSGTAINTASATNTASGPLRLVYVNADSILENFTQFRKEKDALDKKQLDIDTKLGTRGRALEAEVGGLQQRAQSGQMTPKEIQDAEARVQGKQQALVADRDKFAKEIQEESFGVNDRLQKALMSTLEEIKKEKRYNYVLSYVKGGQILIANPADDITGDVLTRLNSKATSTPAPSDTAKRK